MYEKLCSCYLGCFSPHSLTFEQSQAADAHRTSFSSLEPKLVRLPRNYDITRGKIHPPSRRDNFAMRTSVVDGSHQQTPIPACTVQTHHHPQFVGCGTASQSQGQRGTYLMIQSNLSERRFTTHLYRCLQAQSARFNTRRSRRWHAAAATASQEGASLPKLLSSYRAARKSGKEPYS